MLAKITILSSLLFAVIYPLSFWLSANDPLKNNFHRFHLGLPNCVGALAVASLFMEFPSALKIISLLWIFLSLGISYYYWEKDHPNAIVVTIPSILGLIIFLQLQKVLIGPGPAQSLSWILGGLIFSSSLFAMNLGHWYLNVHGLPIAHLKRAAVCLVVFLAARLLWDVLFIAGGQVLHLGDQIPLWQFILKPDGILLVVAILFGTLFPLCAMFFVFGTLKLKNTQATTGILYVILSSILLGDIAYKYYSLKFGIPL